MPQARGSQAVFAIYDETSYGVTPATPAGQKLYLTRFGVASAQNLIDDDTLSSNRARIEPGRGNIDVAGALAMTLSAQSLGKPLKHLLGAVATTGVGPYEHTITPGDLPAGFILEKDHGANISGAGRVEYFNGCRFASAKFSFPREGWCSATFDVKGAKSTLASAALDAALDDYGHTGFSAFSASVQEGGTAIATVTAAEIDYSNDLDEEGYAIGGAGVRRALSEGFAVVRGSITAMFEDATLLTKAINATQTSLKVTLTRGDGLGSAGNESIEFLVNQMKYERTSPAIEGPRGLYITLPFVAYRSGTTVPLQITLKNAVATL